MKPKRTILGWPAHIIVVAAILGIIGLMALQETTPVFADRAKFYLDCPTTQVREGESVDVFLVQVTNHQHSENFGAKWHTDAGTAGQIRLRAPEHH